MPDAVSGCYKVSERDFVVCEELPFEPEGEGEHVYLLIRKSGLNTVDVQQSLARHAGVPRHHVGYAGLKDRQALTSQWFSVYLAGAVEPDWTELASESLQIQQQSRHRRKLRIGAHRANRFTLVLRHISGDRQGFEQRLQQVAQRGFPNYFGEQRFGRFGDNDLTVEKLGRVRRGRLSNRQGMALSALRSRVFNRVLAHREARANWDTILRGELVNLDGSNSFFGPVEEPDTLVERLASLEIHPTGPLPGVEASGAEAEVAELEMAVGEVPPEQQAMLRVLGAKTARRPLRARAVDLRWQWQDDDTLELDFALRRGSYATSLLAAVGDFSGPGQAGSASQAAYEKAE